jgi:hypothetical protein
MRGDSFIVSRDRDDSSAARMTDENSRAADPPQCSMDCRDVAFKTVETVLGCDHFVPIGLKRGDQLAETRAIGPESVSEYNARFGCDIYFFLWLGIHVEYSLGGG